MPLVHSGLIALPANYITVSPKYSGARDEFYKDRFEGVHVAEFSMHEYL